MNLIKEEINVKKIIFDKKIKTKIELDRKITSDLKEEGLVRELARYIQQMRKEANFIPQDLIFVQVCLLDSFSDLENAVKKYNNYLKKEIKALKFNLFKEKISGELNLEKEITIEGKKIWIGIKKKEK